MPAPRGRARGPRNFGKSAGKISTKEPSKLYQPRDKYPAFDNPTFTPLSSEESECIEHFRLFQQEMRDGPFYAFLDNHSRIPKPGELSGSGTLETPNANRDASAGNPFERMRTYSQKFVKSKKTMPRLAQRQYVESFFPPELQRVIAGSKTTQAPRNKTAQQDTQDILAEGVEGALDDDDLMEEEQDDDFNDAEDDEDGRDDYNAEQYFDNGEDDGGDEGGGDYE